MTENKCGSAKQCQFGEMCKPKYDIGGCSHYKEKRPQTNEEWRKTCSAEEFAEWIADKINAKLRMALHDAELYDGDVDEKEYMENEDEWLEWLKEKHDEM
jgi:hypothetical protein